MGLSFVASSGLASSTTPVASLSLVEKAQQEHWADDVLWHRLVQYEPQLLGGVKSQSDSSKFFLDPQGATHPDLELKATLESLLVGTRTVKSRDGKFNEPVACVFPARRMWLEKKSGQKFPDPPAGACERYERFKEILQARSLTYVFSSYYLNNPASGFGHTFLRVNKAPSARDGERYELADYGIGYAAIQVSSNPLVYSLLGVSGMMPGAFDVNPYYFKVREYNDFESRDLWEYDLNFTQDEVKMIIAFIWELSDVNFNYHYFTQNCSYRILAVLEVARPDLNLVDKLKWQVMPADTVQTLYEAPGLVGRIQYRPSVRATFQNRVQRLPADLEKRIKVFAKDESLPPLTEGLDKTQQKEVLDAAMDYLDYRYPNDIMKKIGKYSLKKEVLIARAEVGGVSDSLPITTPWTEAPHDAEGSRRLGVGYRHWQNNGEAALISGKMALHDLLDAKLGYPPTAQITMGDFTMSWKESTRQLALEKATIFDVVSLAPRDDFSKSLSWRLKVANERGYEDNCQGLCRWSELSGGIGWTQSWFDALDVTLWLRGTGQSSGDFTGSGWRAGAGPSAMIRWNRGSFSLLGESYYRYDYKGALAEVRQNTLGAQWTPRKDWGLRVSSQNFNSLQTFDAQLFYYY